MLGSTLCCVQTLKYWALQIYAHNLQPALQWVEEHRQELQQQPQAAGFEFKLYRLSFLHTLQQQGTAGTLHEGTPTPAWCAWSCLNIHWG